MKLTYFYSKEIQSSVELKERVCSLPILNNINVKLIDSDSADFNQLELLLACHRDDIVLIDATIPEDKVAKTVYPILVAQVNMLDHVLVISNNMLPLNIVPQRQGFDSPRYKSQFSKEKQLEWIDEQIQDLSNLISSGKHYCRLPLHGYRDLEKYSKQMQNMWSESENLRKTRVRGKKKVLISYRNSHFDEVYKYKTEYEKLNPDTIVKIVEPGVLCTGEETLTPMRKWMLVFMLEERIRDIDELIVYKTSDYTDSWWTCAELVMVAYCNYLRKENLINVKYYNPVSHSLEEATTNDWLISVELNEKQKNRLARLAANTRPDLMGPECMQNIDQMSNICESINNSNLFVRTFLKCNIRKVFKKSIPTSLSKQERKEMLEKTMELYTNRSSLDSYLADEVFQNDFWNKLSYQIDWPTKAFVYKEKDKKFEIDIDCFLNAPMQELIQYSVEELQEQAEKGGKICIDSSMGKIELKVKQNKNHRYIWLATRMGQPTIKAGNAPGLELIPIFELTK